MSLFESINNIWKNWWGGLAAVPVFQIIDKDITKVIHFFQLKIW